MSGYQTRQIFELQSELRKAADLMRQAVPHIDPCEYKLCDAMEEFIRKYHDQPL